MHVLNSCNPGEDRVTLNISDTSTCQECLIQITTMPSTETVFTEVCLRATAPISLNSSILFQVLWRSGPQVRLDCTRPWPPAATWYGLSECGTPTSPLSPLQTIQESSPSLQGPHQASGPRPEGNAIAMETAPAPSVAPFSSPSPPELPGGAPACSFFASPGESRARAKEPASERPRVRTGHLP